MRDGRVRAMFLAWILALPPLTAGAGWGDGAPEGVSRAVVATAGLVLAVEALVVLGLVHVSRARRLLLAERVR